MVTCDYIRRSAVNAMRRGHTRIPPAMLRALGEEIPTIAPAAHVRKAEAALLEVVACMTDYSSPLDGRRG